MENYKDEECYFYVDERYKPMEIPKTVKAISLRRNRLKEIPESIPENVEYLDVSDNLINIPGTKQFKDIKVLDLGYNLLKTHDEIQNSSLTELYLMANEFVSLSDSLKFHTSLVKFDIASNRIKLLDPLKLLANTIEEIYLGNNKIDHFSVDLTHLTKLRILDLQYNNLEEFDCSLINSKLEILLLNNNPNLEEVKNVEILTELSMFDTDHTKLKKNEEKKEIK